MPLVAKILGFLWLLSVFAVREERHRRNSMVVCQKVFKSGCKHASHYKFCVWSGLQCGAANRVLRSPYELNTVGNLCRCMSRGWCFGFKKPSIVGTTIGIERSRSRKTSNVSLQVHPNSLADRDIAIGPGNFDQRTMRPLLNDLTSFDHNNQIGLLKCGQSMGDNQTRPSR